MPWNLLLFPLLGGFLFIHSCNLFRFRSQRFESERLLLQSASFGVLFGAIGRVLIYWLTGFKWGQALRVCLHQVVPPKDAPYLGSAVAALAIGWLSAYLVNAILRWSFGQDAVKIRACDDELLRVPHDAMFSERPVSLTMNHRKVYIGYVLDGFGDSPHNRHLTLMLLLSGHRSAKSLRFVLGINYADRTILADAERDSQLFTVTVALDDIVSASYFDLEVYKQEFSERLIQRA